MQLFKIHNESRKLTKLQTLEDLCFYLECDKFRLQLNALKPVYYQYKIRKNKVSFRQIEDPADELKKMQRKLNDGLQAVYYYQRPPAVFGFCINTNHETERNIVTNAGQHVKARSLLNIDLKDFFHQISKSKVKQIYESIQPRLDNETSDCVASLCTFKRPAANGSTNIASVKQFCLY